MTGGELALLGALLGLAVAVLGIAAALAAATIETWNERRKQ